MSTGQATQQAPDVKPPVADEGGHVIEVIGIGKGKKAQLWDKKRRKDEDEFYLKIGLHVSYRSNSNFTIMFDETPPLKVDDGVGTQSGNSFSPAHKPNHTLQYWLQVKPLTAPGTGLKSSSEHPNGKKYHYKVCLESGHWADPDIDIMC